MPSGALTPIRVRLSVLVFFFCQPAVVHPGGNLSGERWPAAPARDGGERSAPRQQGRPRAVALTTPPLERQRRAPRPRERGGRRRHQPARLPLPRRGRRAGGGRPRPCFPAGAGPGPAMAEAERASVLPPLAESSRDGAGAEPLLPAMERRAELGEEEAAAAVAEEEDAPPASPPFFLLYPGHEGAAAPPGVWRPPAPRGGSPLPVLVLSYPGSDGAGGPSTRE